MFHSEAGKRQDMPGPFQPCGGLHFFFKHLWISQATVIVMLGWKGDVAQILERATRQQWGPPPDPQQEYKNGTAANGQEEVFLQKGRAIVF